jgi:hypothetical protein
VQQYADGNPFVHYLRLQYFTIRISYGLRGNNTGGNVLSPDFKRHIYWRPLRHLENNLDINFLPKLSNYFNLIPSLPNEDNHYTKPTEGPPEIEYFDVCMIDNVIYLNVAQEYMHLSLIAKRQLQQPEKPKMCNVS